MKIRRSLFSAFAALALTLNAAGALAQGSNAQNPHSQSVPATAAGPGDGSDGVAGGKAAGAGASAHTGAILAGVGAAAVVGGAVALAGGGGGGDHHNVDAGPGGTTGTTGTTGTH